MQEFDIIEEHLPEPVRDGECDVPVCHRQHPPYEPFSEDLIGFGTTFGAEAGLAAEPYPMYFLTGHAVIAPMAVLVGTAVDGLA